MIHWETGIIGLASLHRTIEELGQNWGEAFDWVLHTEAQRVTPFYSFITRVLAIGLFPWGVAILTNSDLHLSSVSVLQVRN